MGAISLLVACAALFLWRFLSGIERAYEELPGAAVEVEGDALSAVALLDYVGPDDPARPRLVREVLAAAETDWRVLAVLLENGIPVDLKLAPAEATARLQRLAADNAYVHLQELSTIEHCCAEHDAIDGQCCGERFAEAASAGMAATRYESPGNAYAASLERRFERVPARRLAWLLPETTKASAIEMQRGMSTLLATFTFDGVASPCVASGREALAACRHLARLVLRDADSLFERMSAISVLEDIGGTDERRDAAAARNELDWLQWHYRRIWASASVGDHDELLASTSPFSRRALRALLVARGIPTTAPDGWTMPEEPPAAD